MISEPVKLKQGALILRYFIFLRHVLAFCQSSSSFKADILKLRLRSNHFGRFSCRLFLRGLYRRSVNKTDVYIVPILENIEIVKLMSPNYENTNAV